MGFIQGIGAWGEKKSQGKVSIGPFSSTVAANPTGKVLLSYLK